MSQHLLNGNCWEKAYDCEACRPGFLCDVCHEHDEMRGDCADCPSCDACDEDEAQL